VALIGSMLEFSGKTVNEVMVSPELSAWRQRANGAKTPMEDVYTLSAEKIVVSHHTALELAEEKRGERERGADRAG
jgi:hypothetical protein